MDLDANFQLLVDQDEVNYKVAQQMNAVFGSDVRCLDKARGLVEELTKARHDLENRLRFATTEAPDKITKAVKAAEDALLKKDKLTEECSELTKLVGVHKAKVEALLEEVGPGVRTVRDLERVQVYQRFANAVDELSKEIEWSLHIGSEGQALVGYARLRDTATLVRASKCWNLLDFVNTSLLHWHTLFISRFSSEFEGVLKSIKWPFSNTGLSQPPASPEATQRLCTLTQYLLQIALPEDLEKEQSRKQGLSTSTPAIIADFDKLLLPLQLLVRPLEVRFMYHFSGNKATNSRENPEWYFTQVLKWVSAHENFLTTRIQQVLNRYGYQHVSAKVELMRGLVRVVVLKLATDLPEVQYDDDLFCATVQETLSFDQELTNTYRYPPSQPSVLAVLTQAKIFARWIHVERKFALELMDELVSDEGAWRAEDSGEAAHCGEQLILLLQGITDRYKRLPQPGHRLQFLELQLELLDDFRVRVLQVMKSERQDPLASHYPAILNTVHHIASTLTDWADLPFFVEMQYYREQFSEIQARTSSAMAGYDSSVPGPTSPDDPTSFTFHTPQVSRVTSSMSPEALAHQDALESLNSNTEVPSESQLAEVAGTVFDGTVGLYEHIQGEMVRTLANFVFTEVRARSQPYRKDKWFYTTNPKAAREGVVSEPSPSVCPMLEVLAKHLHALRDVLANPLFSTLWKLLADTLNKYVYEEVVLQTRFSDMGASQFKFDMTRGLFPIFGEFTQKPENFFKLVKESVILLTLPQATALLLRDTIRMWHDDHDAFSLAISPVKALAEHGVSLLTPRDADVVMNIRIYDINRAIL